MKLSSALSLLVFLAAACNGRIASVDREITLLDEIEFDAWHTRRQFPYEIKYPAITATYSTTEPGEFIRFHCGPVGHMIRHVTIDEANVEELSLIRLETEKGQKLCKKITTRLHGLAGQNEDEPLATLQLEDRHESGRPHVPSIRYKGQVVDDEPERLGVGGAAIGAP